VALLTVGKSGFDIIRFAFKRLPGQDPLVDGHGNIAPEPDYDSEEWKGWMLRLTDERADEILATKKEESPAPETQQRHKLVSERMRIKIEEGEVGDSLLDKYLDGPDDEGNYQLGKRLGL